MLTGLHAVVYERIAEVMRDGESNASPDLIAPAATLNGDLGLGSLDLAQLVVILEQELGADPFRTLVPITSVRTVADLCTAYERALAGERPPDGDDSDLAAVRARAQARVRRRGR